MASGKEKSTLGLFIAVVILALAVLAAAVWPNSKN